MTATMVFVHGRGQEFKGPAALVRTWQADLAAGLVKADMAASAGPAASEQEAFGLDRVLSWGAARPIGRENERTR